MTTDTDTDTVMSLSISCNIKFSCLLKFWLQETKSNTNGYIFKDTLKQVSCIYYIFKISSNIILSHKDTGFLASNVQIETFQR